MSETKTYTGGCHCQENRYEVTMPTLDDENNKVVSCNCSICNTNGYLLAFTDASQLTWEKGGFENMKKYNFNTNNFHHYFCPNCGVSVGVVGAMGGVEKVGINVSESELSKISSKHEFKVRTIDGVDVNALHVRFYDGRST